MESWKEKRDRLCKLIKNISDQHGGDEMDWLREYCKEMILKYRDNLDVPLVCFESLVINNFIYSK